MNICLISGIFPPDIGGPATYVSRLAASLHQEDHDICVITLGDKTSNHPFPVKRVSRSLPLFLRLPFLCLLLLFYGWKSQVWYINGLELPSVLVGKLLRKRLLMKIVGDYAWERATNKKNTSDSIDDFQQTPQHWKVEWHKKIRAWYTRQTDIVITPSLYLKQLVAGWGVEKNRIHVIYNAMEEFSGHLRQPHEVREGLSISPDEQLLIIVGRLVSWKGIDTVIRTLPSLGRSTRLLIAGDGPEKNTLTDLVKALYLTDRVTFVGKTERKKVLELIGAADLFVLNTGYEGFSHVLLESMMMGTPVITTSVCGNPELVVHRQNGMLYQQDNLEELTAQIQTALSSSSLRQTLIDGGYKTVQQFTWEQLLRQTLSVLCDS